jgi:DNA repair exonuclease SbcCD ATPase subunit
MNPNTEGMDVQGKHYCICNDYSKVDTSGTKCMRCHLYIPIASQEVNNSEEVKYSIGDDAYGLKRIIKHIKTTDGLHEVIEIAAGVWDEHAKEIVDACNNYHSLQTQLTDSLTAYNQVCERNDRLQEENDNLRKQLHDHNGMCQKKLSDQLNDVIRDFKAKQEEVDRLKEAMKKVKELTKYNRNHDIMFDNILEIQNVADEALIQTP